jgi:4-alpha-glucanotransferase
LVVAFGIVSVVELERSAGILLHPTSLPSGSLADARNFVDWLAEAGQSWWQVLPLGPPDETGSPYAARSAFAASAALLAEPDAPVSVGEIESFGARHAFWSADWASYGGSLPDEVRFEREWSALRSYAGERGVRLIGDLPIYVAPASADHVAHP